MIHLRPHHDKFNSMMHKRFRISSCRSLKNCKKSVKLGSPRNDDMTSPILMMGFSTSETDEDHQLHGIGSLQAPNLVMGLLGLQMTLSRTVRLHGSLKQGRSLRSSCIACGLGIVSTSTALHRKLSSNITVKAHFATNGDRGTEASSCVLRRSI